MTLTSRHNLATALDNLGHHQQAVELLEQTLTARERELGPNHSDTQLSRNNLANALAALRAGRPRRWWRR